jgi:peptidyl-dipeptidase Dcp
MRSLLLASGTLAAFLAACSGSPKKETVTTEPDVVQTPDTTDTPSTPAQSPHEKALAEVARLKGKADSDPVLAPYQGPYEGVPAWDRYKVDQFSTAFALAIELLQAEVTAIATNPAKADFANTIGALENAGRHLDRANAIFGVFTSNLNAPAVQAVEKEWSPKIAAAYDAIIFNAALFERLSAVHGARNDAGLTPEQIRLTELRYQRFERAGAKLSEAQKKQLGSMNQELAVHFTEFGNKVLADEDTWIVVENEKELDGVPDSLKASYKAAATERKLDGKWALVNTRSVVDAFLAASPNRALREKVWKAFKARGDNGNASDTNATIAKIVKLRADRAKLLGYASHAHWRMSDNTMAVDPAKATDLMMRVWPAAVARVGEEVKDMQAFARKDKVAAFEPWDYLYYSEKVRKKKYDLDAAELKPYFELDNMIKASFFMAGQLYDLHFNEITGQVPVFHPDVRVWDVKDGAGNFVGLFYGDYFARAGKRSGAWMTDYRGHETFTGTTFHTIASNNNNFVKAAPGEPVLISLDDAETLFHEFGHALHYLLSDVNYPGLSTTPRDYVEFPSQVHEMWVLSRPVLDKFARHYKTGKAMPKALLDKIEKSSKFNQGYVTVEYLASAIVDMQLHTDPTGVIDPDAFERETLEKIGAPKEVPMRHRLPHFTHLFTSDSYSAGYYSYMWSDVMAADAIEAFKEAGDVFDKKLAAGMKNYILAPGNNTDRAEAYRQFRGRDPDVRALLKRRGFPTK